MIFKSIYGLSPNQVLSPSDITKKKYDILLVDEAHRLHQYKNISYMGSFKENCRKLGLTTDADELDWVLLQSDCAILFYDRDQVVGPSGIDEDRFREKIQKEADEEKRITAYFNLITEMRVLGGNDYIDFVKNLLNGICTEKYSSDQYELGLYNDFAAFQRDMYQNEKINVPILGLVENMAWFTPAELPQNKYYLFGKEGVKRLAEDMHMPLLGQIPIVQSICESSDAGEPAAAADDTMTALAFRQLADATVKEVERLRQKA